jgi:hypothetical protein
LPIWPFVGYAEPRSDLMNGRDDTLPPGTAVAGETERTLPGARRCAGCGVPLAGRRLQARFCSARCRTRTGREAHRRNIARLLDTISAATEALKRELLNADSVASHTARTSVRAGGQQHA